MSGKDGTVRSEPVETPSLKDALKTWITIGVLSFGGPTGQIALMHRIVVDEKGWLSERDYLGALSFCMLLPGPEAMQLATYAGWRMHGVLGGLAAGLLFVLPGAFVILALAWIYAVFGSVPVVDAIFLGIKAAVLVIVIEALLRIARRALEGLDNWLLAGASFVAIFVFDAPFPAIIALAALYGAIRPPREDPSPSAPTTSAAPPKPLGATIRTVTIWAMIWLVPLAALTGTIGADHVLSQIGWFFSKLAVVTFGGAYAVLAYMAQDAVVGHGWLTAGEMLDGLGLAETTPGPLILVTEFVGYLASYRLGGGPAWLMGLAGAGVALWATFAPCFLWIFAGAPYIDRINARPRLRGALSGIKAAVVGVILNLSLWFALHVFFADVTRETLGPVKLWVPEIGTLDGRVLLLAAISAVLLLHLRWSIPAVLAVSAALATAIRYVPL